MNKLILLLTAGGQFLTAGHAARAEDPGGVLWTANLVRPVTGSAAVAPDGMIYVTGFNNSLNAFDPAGHKEWSFETRSDIKSSPAIGDDGTIYFGGRDGKFYAVTPQGKLKWAFTAGAWVDSSPAIGADGTLYFGCWDQKFYALGPDGKKKWELATGGPIDSSPVIDAAGTIYIGSHDKLFYALNPDGSKRWTFGARGPIVASPAIAADGTLYVPSVDGYLYALTPDGTKKWALHTGGFRPASPILDPNGTIYVGVNNQMSAINPDGNLQVWGLGLSDQNKPIYIDGAAAVTADGLVVFSSDYGSVYAFATNSNFPKWTARVYGKVSAAPAVAPDGTVYIGTSFSTFNAIRGTTGLAESSWPCFRGNLRQTGRVAFKR